ncbi:hypothetical protein [Marinobacter xestospongiae]|uniref:Uncharacterized protein n=1 Tax=Marinobacter xestospongiae TaxID=994319 RepID=A0ABU3W2G1_9GAMM|nr:hypothetical protein [Marinobacter xestospongiae]MDV2080181.1 hypothetical protein [Marinobacter xestospongiae]
MREQITALNGQKSKQFCICLWHQLTIVGRAVWADESLDQAAQLNALKWLNEIQHRVWGAHARSDQDALGWLLDRLVSHCEHAPVLKVHIHVALDRSLAAVVAIDEIQ